MAVQLGYKNVYRDPLGYPSWQEQGLPVAAAPREVAEAGPAAIGHSLGWAMLWTLLGVFVGGMALNLTPCVYPLIPITVSYFGGLSGGSRRRLVGHGLAYMAGLSVTNTVLGVSVALTGGLMGAMLQNPLVLIMIAAILPVFASSIFGLWELRLPQSLTQAAAKSYLNHSQFNS
jgi:thioredoxin:protein disulfide reductase